jgi:peptide/nickel transport system permease protein
MATRKQNADTLEAMAAKGLKLEGIKNMKTTSKIALGILVVVALLSIFAPLIAPNDP